jgi:UPF0176 protein
MASKIVVAAFYKFVALPDFREIRQPMREYCQEQGVKGSILLADEGINGTIAGERHAIDAVLAYLRSDARLSDLLHKESYCDEQPFGKMKVRLKREIVKLGVDGIDPNSEVGTYIPAQAWNDLINQPDVVLVDTRNDYEYKVGTFKGALNPDIEAFNDFPEYVQTHLNPDQHKRVAMFCTGGIRCEKATAYLLQLGFEEVYHLQGGILKYLEDVPEEKSMWEGECFVFDERITVDHDLRPGNAPFCRHCNSPIIDGQCKCSANN